MPESKTRKKYKEALKKLSHVELAELYTLVKREVRARRLPMSDVNLIEKAKLRELTAEKREEIHAIDKMLQEKKLPKNQLSQLKTHKEKILNGEEENLPEGEYPSTLSIIHDRKSQPIDSGTRSAMKFPKSKKKK